MALDGMGMLLKSLGVNPEAIAQGMAVANGKIIAVEESLKRIEQKLDQLLEDGSNGRGNSNPD